MNYSCFWDIIVRQYQFACLFRLLGLGNPRLELRFAFGGGLGGPLGGALGGSFGESLPVYSLLLGGGEIATLCGGAGGGRIGRVEFDEFDGKRRLFTGRDGGRGLEFFMTSCANTFCALGRFDLSVDPGGRGGRGGANVPPGVRGGSGGPPPPECRGVDPFAILIKEGSIKLGSLVGGARPE